MKTQKTEFSIYIYINLKSIFWLVFSIIFLATCTQKKNEQSKTANEIEQPEIKKLEEIVFLTLDKKSWELSKLPGSLQISMVNNTKDTIVSGEYIRIEKIKNDSWMDISPDDIAYDDIGYLIPPGDTMVFEENMYQNKIDYQPGIYRITKKYLKSDYQKTRREFNVFAEFLIE